MKIYIRTSGKAFDHPAAEKRQLAKLLREQAKHVAIVGQPGRGEVWTLYDRNGQACGTVRR